MSWKLGTGEAWDNNPYYNPENCGLVTIGEANDPTASYSFDDFVVWKDVESGVLYYAQDAGCSCPSPFENFTGLEDMSVLTDETWPEFTAALKEWSEYKGDAGLMEVHELLMKVIKEMAS